MDGVTNDKWIDKTRRRILLLRILCVVLMVLLLSCTIVFSGSVFSEETFRYLFRCFDAAGLGQLQNYGTVYCKTAPNAGYGAYTEQLVIWDDRDVQVYDGYGNCLLSEEHEMQAPAFAAGASSFLLYENGGSRYTVYQAFSRLYTEQVQGVIVWADVAREGGYCIVTRMPDGQNAITIYRAHFEKQMIIQKSQPVLFADLSADGTRLAVTTYRMETEESVTQVYTVGLEETPEEIRIFGEMPQKTAFDTQNRLILLTNRALRCYDNSTEPALCQTWTGQTLAGSALSGDRILLILRDAYETSRTAYTWYASDGTMLAEATLSGVYRGVAAYGNFCCILTDTTLYGFTQDAQKKEIPLITQPLCAQLCAQGDVFLFYEGKARAVLSLR